MRCCWQCRNSSSFCAGNRKVEVRVMATKLRFDFPSEIVEERSRVYGKIQELLARQTLDAVVEARQLHLDWLQKHPDDYVTLDAGEVLAMTESAYRQSEDTSGTEPFNVEPALTK